MQSPPAFLVLVQTEDMHLEILVKICTMFINNSDHILTKISTEFKMDKIMLFLMQSPPAFLVLVQIEDMHLEILVKICIMFTNNSEHILINQHRIQDGLNYVVFDVVSASSSSACSTRRHALGNTGENMLHVH